MDGIVFSFSIFHFRKFLLSNEVLDDKQYSHEMSLENHSINHFKSRFLEENGADITEVKPEGTLGHFDEIDELDDEVWLMQCPKGIDVTKLTGERLKLPGRSKIAELETVAMELNFPKKEAFGFTNRKGRYALRLLPISGSVILRNPLKSNDAITKERIEEICQSVGRVPMPKGLRVRHPLLGVDYEVKLREVPTTIMEQLKRADEMSTLVLKEALSTKNKVATIKTKSKSKRLSEAAFTKIKIEDDSEIEFVDEIKKQKKKRARKHSELGDASIEQLNGTSPSKLKKKSKVVNQSCIEDDSDLQWLKEL